jgi:Domain of unknown function (DUF4440)
MKYIYVTLLAFIIYSCAPKMCSEAALLDTFNKKNAALVDDSTLTLKELALPQLSFVHSNGWKEDIHSFLSKSDVKQLKYNAIKIDSIQATVVDKTGLLSGLGTFDINYKNNDLKISLYFTETYVCKNGDWKLLARHSCKKP